MWLKADREVLCVADFKRHSLLFHSSIILANSTVLHARFPHADTLDYCRYPLNFNGELVTLGFL